VLTVEVRPLTSGEVELVGSRLPLNRLDRADTYLIAWEAGEPVGHAHIAWAGTRLGVAEIQDAFVVPERRGCGVGTELSLAAERTAVEHGETQLSVSASVANKGALRLYRRLGYTDAGVPPQRVQGTIHLRSGPIEVDDTLVYLIKKLE